jgi:hypothetical protein
VEEEGRTMTVAHIILWPTLLVAWIMLSLKATQRAK